MRVEVSRRGFLAGTGGLLAAKTRVQANAAQRTRWPAPEILNVADEPGKVTVETTGSVFTFQRSHPGRIVVSQKINGPRELVVMEWETSFAKLTVDARDGDNFIAYIPVTDTGFNVRVYPDSLLSIRAGKGVRVRTFGRWLPQYSYAEAGNLLFLDSAGGYGQYLLPTTNAIGGAAEQLKPGISFSGHGWETCFNLPKSRTMLACVAPPRPFDWRSSAADRIVHHLIAGKRTDGTWDYFPSDSAIRDYARWGNILVLHVWQQGAGPYRRNETASRSDFYQKAANWACWRYIPLDEAELARVLKTAHQAGMQVLPYVSPYYFPGNSREILEELARLLRTYPFDGFYFDNVSQDILEAYEIMKGTRRLLGPERWLYVHVPSPILGTADTRGRYVYCPFIDTYANFILRSEHLDNFDENVLRYTISGYNISNTIGFVCNYDYHPDFNRKLIREALSYNVRVPYWAGWNIYLADLGKDFGRSLVPEEFMHEAMRRDYFPALDMLKEKYTSR